MPSFINASILVTILDFHPNWRLHIVFNVKIGLINVETYVAKAYWNYFKKFTKF